jgi:hypothetical protein
MTRLPRYSVKISIETSSEAKKSASPSKKPKTMSKSSITVQAVAADILQERFIKKIVDGLSCARQWANKKPTKIITFHPTNALVN